MSDFDDDGPRRISSPNERIRTPSSSHKSRISPASTSRQNSSHHRRVEEGNAAMPNNVQTNMYDLPPTSKVLSIHTAIRDTLDKLDIISNLNPTSDNNVAHMNDTVLQTIEERKRLETEFQHIMKQRESMNSHSKRAAKDNQMLLKEIMGTFRAINKRLTQKLSSESSSSSAMLTAKIRKEKARMFQILHRSAKELKSTSSCPTLFTTLQDEKDRESRYGNTLVYVQHLKENITTLSKSIEVEREARLQQENQARQHIARLKEELRIMKTDLSVNQRVEQAESNAKLHTQERLYRLEEQQLRQKLEDVRQRLDREIKTFKLTQDFLQRRYDKAEALLEHWTQKKENDIRQTMAQLDELSERREEVLHQLRFNEESFKREVAEKEEREEKERRKQEEYRMFIVKVVKCQAYMRGFLARRLYARMLAAEKAAAKKPSSKKNKKKNNGGNGG